MKLTKSRIQKILNKNNQTRKTSTKKLPSSHISLKNKKQHNIKKSTLKSLGKR